MTSSTPMDLDSTGDVFLQDDLGPTIAEHAMKCDQLFKKYMRIPEITPDPTVLDDQLARFTLWASNMDVFGPLNVALDYRLRYSPTVVEIIHQLLDVICDSLKSLKPIDDPPQTPSRKKRRISIGRSDDITQRIDDDSSDSDSNADQAQKNDSLISYTIGGTVTRLFRLSNAIRKSAKASRTSKIEGYRDDEEANNAIDELRLYTDSYIRFRYPLAPETLRSALVEANALRLRRFYYQRSHRRRIALNTQSPQVDTRNVQLPKIQDNASVVRFASIVAPKPRVLDEGPKLTEPPPAPITYATTARQTAVGALYADSTVDIPRIKSVIVNNKLSFPPVPTTSECPYCGVIVEFKGAKKNILWNDHVIRDLEPFVCIFPHCSNSSQQDTGLLTFETSNAWISHMQTLHGHAWECRAPSHSAIVFERELDFREHSCQEHGVPEAHVGKLSGAARRPIFKKIIDCPFGDDFSVTEMPESKTIFSSEAVFLHVAAHMKEIALLALQKLPSDDDAESEDVASDAPLEDSGPARLRESMYSVLDDETLDFVSEVAEGKPNLLEKGINTASRLDLEDRDESGLTKLHRAILNDDFRLASSLMALGANIYSKTNSGVTILHYVSGHRYFKTDMIKSLLTSGATEFVNLKDDRGQTPLHYAAKAGFHYGIDLLLDNGATIDVLDENGFSPLLWTVIGDKEMTARLLLSRGADVNSTCSDGKSALSWASSLGHSSMATLLLDKGADVMAVSKSTQNVPLEGAAAYGDLFTVQKLLELGVDPNYRDRDGWSALHWAAEEGHLRVLRLLLENGASINAVSSYGTSPLHCAANGGHDSIVEELLQRGADPDKSSCHGWTPLHHAAYRGFSSIVLLLLKFSSPSSNTSPDNHGWSTLHLAVLGRHLGTVKILLKSSTGSASRLQSDENGLTVEDWLDLEFDSHSYESVSNLAFNKSRCCRPVTKLRLAVRDNNIILVEFFLEQKEDVNGTDSGRITALYYAAKKGNIAILDLLLERGADPNILPVGRQTWEEFISDDAILSRLRRAGYKKAVPDSDVDYQIKLALSERGRVDTLGRPLSHSPTPTASKEGELDGTPGESRYRVTKLWKRLRGQ